MGVGWNFLHPEPAPPAFAKGTVLPETNASWLSRVVFQWLSPFLRVGFSRPLEKEDLWELPPLNQAAQLTQRVEQEFYRRCAPEQRPTFFTESTNAKALKKPDNSLFKALHSAFLVRWWIAGFFYLASETLRTTTPLVTREFLTWLTESYVYLRLPVGAAEAFGVSQPHGVGFGIGLAFAVFVMQQLASLLANHFYLMTMTNGLCVRSSLIGAVFRKSLRLSGRARSEHSVGKITTMISTDASRLDEFSAFAHGVWVAPVQIAICIGLLIHNLGYSALVGLAVLIVGMIPQGIMAAIIFHQRQVGVKFTDSRMRLTTEVLQGIRILKAYGWEAFYAHQIEKLRKKEVTTLKKSAAALSGLIALVTVIPVLCAITYSLTGHDLNVAIIFSSLQLFNVLMVPMATFPIVLGSLSGAIVAMNRIGTFLVAEELPPAYPVDSKMKYAVDLDGDFTWETTEAVAAKFNDPTYKEDEKKPNTPKTATLKSKKSDKGGGTEKSSKAEKHIHEHVSDVSKANGPTRDDDSVEIDIQPFALKGLKFRVERGQFVAIVGPVASGKSSLIQSLIGEMRKTSGQVTLGGTVSYVPQRAWIRNASLRENILFGQPVDEDRLRQVIHACSLDHDLSVLPQGEHTEIGEKGINLSGGQKARVSLARAAYSETDIVLLDDPLSAVDAYVGQAILENCLLSGPLAHRTRILVTHALHVLHKTDYIYVMDHGEIVEQGTYQDLIASNGAFNKLVEEFGSQNKANVTSEPNEKSTKAVPQSKAPLNVSSSQPLMQDEERVTGAVAWSTYAKYLRYGGGIFWAPLILLLLILDQGAYGRCNLSLPDYYIPSDSLPALAVANSLFLGFWTAGSIPGFSQSNYMAVYGCLGAASALTTFALGLAFSLSGLIAGFNLFKAALSAVLKSPVAFFDTTPMGRILSRLSKDQDVLDNELAMVMFRLLATVGSLFGTAGLVFYTFPYLGIIFAPMIVVYYGVAVYYRRTSIETKRLDSLMRSTLYASFSESLTGLSTIRAYRSQESSVTHAQRGLDMQNRAYYMTLAIQRWLALRLELMSNILTLGILMFSVGFRDSVNPSRSAVVLTYTLAVSQAFAEMINLFAQNEQNMNAVERILTYTELPSEGSPSDTPDSPPPSWPEKGAIEFSNVDFAYRDNLPLVLKNVSFSIQPGEKIGIVGRTGSGKSSLIQALFR
ncbi:hypothetical protein ONZ45_g12317 [Pleurotus djamor]|nr:hypothetical protein ONZ45_g12317 [Pleurotus djamor]